MAAFSLTLQFSACNYNRTVQYPLKLLPIQVICHSNMQFVRVLYESNQHHPYHIKGLILMGDIYINHQRNLAAAEASFRKILEIEPHHVQANHNLCVVFVEQGDLAKAETCLVETLKLAPNESYIQQHLNIVRNRLRAHIQVRICLQLVIL
jgi:cytochrome c-type biogenesis protein CcmH/NrfG